ncbi:hypothetical protein [Luteimicrobium album]|uniref:hypothetical protein n=1 Tax=Luteimicrobium album TaxID=1054550 RepID=UPI0024E143B8|nr:hypothetical protein [Luteimicrobium album]
MGDVPGVERWTRRTERCAWLVTAGGPVGLGAEVVAVMVETILPLIFGASDHAWEFGGSTP